MSNNDCAICWERLSRKPVGTTVPCGHCFHMDCYQQLRNSSFCPMCNQATTGFCRIYLDLGGTTPPRNTEQSSRTVSPDDTTQRGQMTARHNNATKAFFTNDALDTPFAQGAFRLVAKGTYTHGERRGQACVCKWFKTGHVFEDTFYDLDIKAMDKAVELVAIWNQQGFIGQLIKVNVPQVWVFNEFSSWAGRRVLHEPFIKNYRKFNSNTGWADDGTDWTKVMQALSHYSYHVSNGDYVLCDLQGGLYSNSVVLTDPVILSKDKSFGVTDLGSRGISSFFSCHRCNQYCRSNWRKPADRTRYFTPQSGTSMMTGTATSNPPPPRVSRR